MKQAEPDEILTILARDARTTPETIATLTGRAVEDVRAAIAEYERQGIIKQDPFISLDIEGVGELVKIAAQRGRKTRPELKLGICGEHGGDPASVRFFAAVGLDYVSCSPYRVPIAKLAAAQAALADDQSGRKGEG